MIKRKRFPMSGRMISEISHVDEENGFGEVIDELSRLPKSIPQHRHHPFLLSLSSSTSNILIERLFKSSIVCVQLVERDKFIVIVVRQSHTILYFLDNIFVIMIIIIMMMIKGNKSIEKFERLLTSLNVVLFAQGTSIEENSVRYTSIRKP